MYPLMAIVGIVSLLLLTSFSDLKKMGEQLSYSVKQVKFDYIKSVSSGLSSLYFDSVLILKNPTAGTIQVKEIYFSLFYLNKEISTTKSVTPFSIQPNAESSVSIKSIVDSKKIATSIKDLVDDLLHDEVNIDIKGLITLSIGSFPFKKTIRVI